MRSFESRSTWPPPGERIVGTTAYMSPEQAEGRPVDSRSDIFSFGVMLYEMATGQRPFKGDTDVALMAAIVKDTPPPLTDGNPRLPTVLADVVRRCLEGSGAPLSERRRSP
jgi:eukaryotic-like serine/threonine-protein kinase